MKREPITQKQRAVLSFIRNFTNGVGYPPSYDEMCAYFGVQRNAIQQHIKALEKKNYLRRTTRISRGLVVL